MAGAIFGLAIAYLALPNLRYRDQVNRMASKALRRLDDLNPPDELCKTHYGRLVKFSDGLATTTQRDRLELNGKDIPETEDSSAYSWLFPITKENRISRDAKSASILAVVCFLILALGVIETGDILGLGALLKATPHWIIVLIFGGLAVSTLIPITFVLIGRRWVEWARSQIDYLETRCWKDIKAENITAGIPSSPPTEADVESVMSLIEAAAERLEQKRAGKAEKKA